MGKKMKLPFLFKTTQPTSSWPWPTCGNPKTLSFRAGHDMFRTINSAYVSTTTDSPDSSKSGSFSTPPAEEYSSSGGVESVETVIRGLRSERLFFEPGETSSILEEANKAYEFPFKESVVMAMESRDPFVDFKRSMEEMVEAHELKDWDCLQELLSWYLRVNGKSNHGYIVGAFVDLLVGLTFGAAAAEDYISSSNSALSFSFSNSSTTSPCSSSLEVDQDESEKTADNASSSEV